MHKQMDVAIEDIGSLDETGNEIYVIGNPGFNNASQFVIGDTAKWTFPKAVRDYDGSKSGSTSGSRTTGA